MEIARLKAKAEMESNKLKVKLENQNTAHEFEIKHL